MKPKIGDNPKTCFICQINQCTCENGVAATGISCNIDGQSNCVDCDLGFELDQENGSCVEISLGSGLENNEASGSAEDENVVDPFDYNRGK